MRLPNPDDKEAGMEIPRAGQVLSPLCAQLYDTGSPLFNLTKNCQPQRVHWSEECEEAFQALKEQLNREPVLSHPDFTKPFILQTDALEVGLRVVLSQEIEGEEHPILYLSCKPFPQETRYSTVEREPCP